MDARDPGELWWFLPWGYLATVLLEFPVLWFGLSRRHPARTRILAALWLTACTYPMVILVLPLTVERWWGTTVYIAIAEVFAPLAECLLFHAAFVHRLPETARSPRDSVRDALAVTLANVTSFVTGMVAYEWDWI